MELDLKEQGDVTILVIDGNLTLGREDALRESIDTILGSGRSKILVDLTGMDYMDSAGLGELVASYRTVKRFGGMLKLLKPSDKVTESLTVTSLLPMFQVFSDQASAVKSFEES